MSRLSLHVWYGGYTWPQLDMLLEEQLEGEEAALDCLSAVMQEIKDSGYEVSETPDIYYGETRYHVYDDDKCIFDVCIPIES